jgi:hypothetical protein
MKCFENGCDFQYVENEDGLTHFLLHRIVRH